MGFIPMIGAMTALNGAASSNRQAHRNMMRNRRGSGSSYSSDSDEAKRYNKTYEEHYEQMDKADEAIDSAVGIVVIVGLFILGFVMICSAIVMMK